MAALETKIIESLNGLYQAIEQAHAAIQSRGPSELTHRLENYLKVVTRQKSVAQSLRRYYLMGDFARLKKQAELIRNTAQLISLDVQSILEQIYQKQAA